MKAKDFIIIGGAIALYYLYQKNKTKTSTTSTAETQLEAQEETTSSGGGGGGGNSMPSTPVTPKPSTPTLVSGGTTSGSPAVVTIAPEIPIKEIIVGGTIPIPALVPMPIQTPEESLISGGIRPIVKPNRNISTEII